MWRNLYFRLVNIILLCHQNLNLNRSQTIYVPKIRLWIHYIIKRKKLGWTCLVNHSVYFYNHGPWYIIYILCFWSISVCRIDAVPCLVISYYITYYYVYIRYTVLIRFSPQRYLPLPLHYTYNESTVIVVSYK